MFIFYCGILFLYSTIHLIHLMITYNIQETIFTILYPVQLTHKRLSSTFFDSFRTHLFVENLPFPEKCPRWCHTTRCRRKRASVRFSLGTISKKAKEPAFFYTLPYSSRLGKLSIFKQPFAI